MAGAVDPERSARGRSARSRGNQSERLWAGLLRGCGWPDAERAVRTGFRTAERASADPGDIRGCPGLVWSLKYLSEDLTQNRATILLDETAAMRPEDGHHAPIGILVERRKGRLPARWWCWLWLDQLAKLTGGPFGSASALTITERMPVRLVADDLIDLLHANGYGLSSADQGERAG